MLPSVLTGTAGEHYVAYKLTTLGFVVALTRGGSPSVDLIVGDLNGRNTVSLQVKSTEWAVRERGRGKNRRASRLEFPLGFKSGKVSQANYFFAFVDLRLYDDNPVPVVYIVPSQFTFDWCKSWIDDAKMVRFHIDIADIAPFKDNYEMLKTALERDAGSRTNECI
jgi:hypothetical protein